MIREPTENLFASEEQARYADVLGWGSRLGFLALATSFIAYILEWLPPKVAFADLPDLWSRPVGEYLAATGIPTGWGWLAHAYRGDLASLVGVVVLSAVSAVCLLAVIPGFAARRDRVFVAICTLEVAVLMLAASGLLTAGH